MNLRLIQPGRWRGGCPRIIKNHAKELKKASLPLYLTLWIHEYSHFIGYCLQKRPIAVAIPILYRKLLDGII